MFDKEQWKSSRQPTAKQLQNLRRDGIQGGPSFVQWFRKHVSTILSPESCDAVRFLILLLLIISFLERSVFVMDLSMRTYGSCRMVM
jgi:hypothetical protein